MILIRNNITSIITPAQSLINKTQYKENVKDALNVICIMHDGDEFLHMAKDHRVDPLQYAVSLEPKSHLFLAGDA